MPVPDPTTVWLGFGFEAEPGRRGAPDRFVLGLVLALADGVEGADALRVCAEVGDVDRSSANESERIRRKRLDLRTGNS